ncbi:nucleoside triphosphate pyrophosphohydrolase [Rodentibacter caecimuris]|uniref:Nucleoside triphosphate pyrophosphohydrolase n=1 Tax=Rodentibacter caecimuris TaxID=1796644 RepID=A0ABX3L097_9PAST|nr:nucleoside triphosphate pyrophosphohydrolase [Rodentibacter heylii]
MSYSIQDFVNIIAQLRNPNSGCPWDLQQTYETIIPCLTEETYEVIEAIQQKDTINLREELGDLLLQVVFLSQLAAEENNFTFNDVVNEVAEKIIRRHPHVFGEHKAQNAEQALLRWNEMKDNERKEKGESSILDNIPQAFPALLRAEKLQKRCAKVGFDWNETKLVFDKVNEELAEVRAELDKNEISQTLIEEEIGDLLFSVVNLARHLRCSPEESLRKANIKFEMRFRAVESLLERQGKTPKNTSLCEMDILWNLVKEKENQSS